MVRIPSAFRGPSKNEGSQARSRQGNSIAMAKLQ